MESSETIDLLTYSTPNEETLRQDCPEAKVHYPQSPENMKINRR